VRLFDEVTSKLKEITAYIFLVHVLDPYLEEWLKKLIEGKVKGREKAEKYFQTLTTPRSPTKLYHANEELKKIAGIAKARKTGNLADDKKILQAVEKYVRKHSWIGYDTGVGNDLNVEETFDRVKRLFQKPEAKFDFGKHKKQYSKIVRELKLGCDEKKTLKILEYLILLRSLRVEAHAIAGANIKPLLEKVARLANTDYDSLVYLTPQEIRKAIKKGQVDSKAIALRKKDFGVVMRDGKIRVFGGGKVKALEEADTPLKDITELQGLIANNGRAVGYAKIVLRTEDFSKVEDGDILVSRMTSPDFISIVSKSSAIVTDIGGVTSHAAVVAREMGKPCITGTKYATQVFKDGDLIEVDGSSGVVRIIERRQ
jgi:phosphohistidine swiveling domain-containing protein